MPNGDQLTTPGQVLTGQPAPPPPPSPSALDYPRQTLPLPVAPPQPTPQQVAELHHNSLVGRAAKVLFGAPVTDPRTGESVPQRPGALFRSLLAGALLGGALASEPGAVAPGAGFAGGLARGAAGVEKQIYQRQQDALAREQERKKLDLEESRQADEEMLHEAMSAHLTAETSVFHYQQHWHNQEVLDKKNAAAREYVRALNELGATPVRIPIDGIVPATNEYSATDLANAFMRDNSILHGPTGSVRHFVDLQNAEDLDYVPGKGWFDPSGKPANLSNLSVVKVYDVPPNLYKQHFTRTGADLNKIAGYQLVAKDREKDNFDVTIEQLTAMMAQNLKNANQKAQADQRDAAADKARGGGTKRGTPAQFAAVEAKKAAALAKAESAYRRSVDRGDPEQDARADLDQAKAEAQKAYEDEVRDLGGSVNSPGLVVPQTPPPAQPVPKVPVYGR